MCTLNNPRREKCLRCTKHMKTECMLDYFHLREHQNSWGIHYAIVSYLLFCALAQLTTTWAHAVWSFILLQNAYIILYEPLATIQICFYLKPSYLLLLTFAVLIPQVCTCWSCHNWRTGHSFGVAVTCSLWNYRQIHGLVGFCFGWCN